MFDLEAYRISVENFNGETDLEYYLNWSGQKDDLNISGIYDKYADLFDKKSVARIRQLRSDEKKGSDGERRLSYLQAFVTEGLMSQSVKKNTDEAYTVAAKEIVKIDGEVIPFRLAAVRIANEDDRKRRAAVFGAWNRVIDDKLNPIRLKRLEKLHAMAKELSYSNYVELYQDTKGINFEELNNMMSKFATETESLWLDNMGKKTQQVLGIDLALAEKHDVEYIFRAKQFDSNFKKDKTLTTLDRTLNGIGFDIAQHKNVMIDFEERPKKDPRAFTAMVRVPDDIRLVIMPKGGQEDYVAMLHEAGHTVHYASISPSLAMEYKWLGDSSVTETYAFLLEYLTLNATWLKDNLGIKNTDEYLDFAYLHKLFFLRRYAAKLRYELLLHKSRNIGVMRKSYKKELETSMKFRHPEEHYLTDLDDGFYCAQYLRAWIFEAQLASKMVEKFGEAWYRSPEAGRFLMELWSLGQKYNVEELARRIGYNGLDTGATIAELTEHFG
jgi:oligoendopeptidase F